MKRFIDIGANLTDPMFSGVYHGVKRHEGDLEAVLGRAAEAGVRRMLVTGTSLEESRQAIQLARAHGAPGPPLLSATVGCHPTKAGEFEAPPGPAQYLDGLRTLAEANRDVVVALGECGLDYARLQFCPKDTQLKYLEAQLELSTQLDLPLFLHCRDAAEDLLLLLASRPNPRRGVVHSYDGSLDHARQLLDFGYYIGLNGCSLKTQENLATARALPSDRILLETDCPWCEIRPSHAASPHVTTKLPSSKKEKWTPGHLVRGRNEPCNIVQVFEALVAIRNEHPLQFAEQIYKNTCQLFFPNQI